MNRPTRRTFLAAAALGGSLAGCVNPLSGSGSASGMTIDTLSVAGSPGDSVAVAPDGSTALLDFFATWCGPCKPQMAELRAVRERFPDLHMLSITWENNDSAVESFWRTHEGTWPVAQDPELRTGEAFGIESLPTLLVVDADGEERWRHVGLAAAESITEQVRAARE